jgi:hypothetical protein
MLEKSKIWFGLSASLLASTSITVSAAVAGTRSVGLGVGSAVQGFEAPASEARWRTAQHAPGKGGEGGEGGERGAAADLTRSGSAYLTQLGLIRGHLDVGVELYRVGELHAATTHMKHPDDELYAALKPALAKRGAPGFEKELQALAATVAKHASPARVDAAYRTLQAAIGRAEAAVAKPSPHQIGEVILNLIRTAADEYRVAVADGKVVEPHEYQDALGFVRVAEDWLKKLEAAGADASVVSEIRSRIASIRPAWAGVVPPKSAAVDPSQIYGAAARIEIATLALKPE